MLAFEVKKLIKNKTIYLLVIVALLLVFYANFIKDNVDFFIKSQQNTYKNGDVITIGAYVDMNAATENGYKIEITHKKITITEQERTND